MGYDLAWAKSVFGGVLPPYASDVQQMLDAVAHQVPGYTDYLWHVPDMLTEDPNT